MKHQLKILLLLTAITILPSLSMAQNVTVTGTITDTQSTPYSNGTLTVSLVNTTGQQATFGGNPAFQKVYSASLDSTGAFSISIPPNSTASPSIQPAGTQWNFSYQAQGGYGAANINVTISSSSSISGTLSSLTRITWPYGNIPPPGGSGQVIVFVSSTTLGWGTNGLTFVAALPGTCTPGVTASVQLSVAPYTINYCSATNTWTASTGAGAVSGQATNAIPVNTNGVSTALNASIAAPTTPNSVPFILTSTPSGGVGQLPAYSWSGVGGRTSSAASDTILATDRATIVTYTNAGAIAVSVPQSGTTNFANNFYVGIKIPTTSGTVTLTPAAGQIAGNSGVLGPTLTLPPSSTAYCYSFDNINYQCTIVGPGSAVGTQSAYDNFNRANGGLGSNWTTMENAPLIAGNQLSSTGQVVGNQYDAYWSSTTFASDQFAQGTFISWTTVANLSLLVRASGTATPTYYRLLYDGTNTFIDKILVGALTRLTTTATSLAANDILRIEVIGNTITTYKNGVQITSTTDSAIASGQPGISVGPVSAGLVVWDNWSGGNIHAAANVDVESDWTQPQHFQTITVGQTAPVAGTLPAGSITSNGGFLQTQSTHAITMPVTIGSGTSIGSTILCATADCPAGTYIIPTYLDITTPCGTSGTYIVNLIYTDDQGAKTVVVNINGTGSVPATGTLTTTSTANYGENSQVIRVTSGNINYSTTATACGTAGPMVGKLYMVANRVM